MSKKLGWFCTLAIGITVFASMFAASGTAEAQSDVALEKRKAELQELSRELKKQSQAERKLAHKTARQKGMPIGGDLPNGRAFGLQKLRSTGEPVFYITDNIDAADTVSTDEVWPGGSAGLNLEGAAMKIGEWDAAAVLNHTEFGGRVTQMDSVVATHDHSTHVAGTMISAGNDPAGKGMASAALLEAYDWEDDVAEMAAAAAAPDPIPISNHSYGVASGWVNVNDPDCNNWWWMGGDANIEDYKFGFYDTDAQTWDQVAFLARDYLIVKSAGNDRNETGPGLNGSHCVVSEDETVFTPSNTSRNSDCMDGIHPPGYDCLPTISTAKNILTVGAVDDYPGGYSSFPGSTGVLMSSFSGWGPTDDGRIKPDLVGNGVEVYSATSTWCFIIWCFDHNIFSGTSMAAPNVSGSLLLLQEHYQDTHGGSSMKSATLKALAIHGADEAGDGPGPDYEFGYGLLNTKTAAKVISEDGGAHRIIEDTLVNSGAVVTQVNVNEPEAVIKATLVWTDPPGTPVAASIDPTDLMLVNDLDLRITSADGIHQPWILDPAVPEATATTGDNFRDNVEQVLIADGGPGAYFVEVTHKGTLLDGLDQDFSLVISVTRASSAGSSTIMEEDFSGGLPPGWSIVNNSAGGVGPEWEIIDPVPSHPELDNYTGGSGKFAVAYFGDLLAPFDTELRTGSIDLSAHDEVTLEFKTHFGLFYLEKISVDVSNDGGTSWNEAWSHQYSNIFGPATQLVPISAWAANQSDVMIRFQFESINELDGLVWQVDDFKLNVPSFDNPDDVCGGTYRLPANQWRFVSLPCDPGPSNSILEIFGDDLVPADYGTTWIMYDWEEAGERYLVLPNTAAALHQGEGYFLLSLNQGLLDMTGTATPLTNSPDCPSPDSNCFEIPVVKPAGPGTTMWNALGHPLPFPVNWADVRIVAAGDPDSPMTPSEALAKDYLSKVTYKYTGSAYVPFDDVTPGYDEGALGVYDAFWVETLGGSLGTGDLSLLIPNVRSPGIITTDLAAASTLEAASTVTTSGTKVEKVPPGLARRDEHRKKHREAIKKGEEWYVRLTVSASAEELVDDGNILGQLLDSEPGFDQHDLYEAAPNTPYLTIVFPQDTWGEYAGDYTSDYHPVTGKKVLDQWVFEVRSDDPDRQVRLEWAGPENILGMSRLTDQSTGQVIEVDPHGSYSFVMGAQQRQFTWEYENCPGKSCARH
jgi:hypothetical protein